MSEYLNFVYMKYKILIIVVVLLFSISNVFSQKCASHSKLLEIMENDAHLRMRVEQFKNSPNNHLRVSSTYPKVTIPVVVHVLYNTAQQNISDAQIYSQIDVLNRDFNAMNADSLPANHEFYNLVGNANIDFCLANKKPDGTNTTGIERRQVSRTEFEYGDADENIIKSTPNGGLSAWNTSKYLNIWIVNFGDGTIGYATFPDENAGNKDGVVIAYNTFGTIGTLQTDYDRGRTTTHEIGHWLGLYHIWGDVYDCTTDDGIDDTPMQYEETYDCPCLHPLIDQQCSTSIMYQNFMDYTDDACMSLFTKGQVNRMRDILNTASNRTSFLNNTVTCGTHTPTVDNGVYCDITLNNNNYLNSNIKVYPNPVSNTLYIEKLPPSISDYHIKIFNNIGAELWNESLNVNKTNIDVSFLNTGIYYLQISNYKIKFSTIIQIVH